MRPVKTETQPLKSQIKLGTVFGVELGLHYSWLVIAVLITFSLAAQFHATNRNWSDAVVWSTAILTGVMFFVFLFAHELSHAIVAKARGIPIHQITLFLLGGVAQIEKEASDGKIEFWMAIVGPFTSAALGVVLLVRIAERTVVDGHSCESTTRTHQGALGPPDRTKLQSTSC